jgi:hypothetical protein
MQGLLQALLAPRAGKDSVSIWRHTVCLRQLNKQHFNSEEKGVKQCLFSSEPEQTTTVKSQCSAIFHEILKRTKASRNQACSRALQAHFLFISWHGIN